MTILLRLAACVACLLAFAPRLAPALELGPIEARSALHEPLDARIPVRSARSGDLEGLDVALGSPARFEHAGVARLPHLELLVFAVEQESDTDGYIRVRTNEPITEPSLAFLIDVGWPRGRTVRSYRLRLSRAAAGAADTPPRSLRAAPEAQPTPDAGTAGAGASGAGTTDTASGPSSGSGGIEYGPVRKRDTLWSIATRFRPDGSVSIQRMMLAILEASPESFEFENVNALNAGTTLRIPARDEIAPIDPAAVIAEVRRQHSAWAEYRQGSRAAPAPTPAEASLTPGDTAPASTTSTPTETSLTPGDTAPAPTTPTPAEASLTPGDTAPAPATSTPTEASLTPGDTAPASTTPTPAEASLTPGDTAPASATLTPAEASLTPGDAASAPATSAPTEANLIPGDAAPAPATPPGDSGEVFGRIEIASSETAATGQDAGADVEGLRKELALAMEEVDVGRREREEFGLRLAEAEDHIKELNRLVELKNQEIAALQAELRMQAEATPAEVESSPVPAPEEAEPAPEEAAPASEEAAPAPEEAAPASEEATPASEEATPASEEATPAPEEATPASEEATPAPEEATPAPEEATPAPEEAAPAPEEAAPGPEEAAPASEEAAPAPEEAASVPEEVTPASEEAASVPEEVTPASEEAATAPEEVTQTPEEAAPAPEEAAPAPEEAAPAPEEAAPASEEATPASVEAVPAPEEVTRTPEEAATAPEEAAPEPEKAVPAPEEAVPALEEATSASEETALAPVETAPAPEEAASAPEEATPAPEEATPAPEEAATASEETAPAPPEAQPAPAGASAAVEPKSLPFGLGALPVNPVFLVGGAGLFLILLGALTLLRRRRTATGEADALEATGAAPAGESDLLSELEAIAAELAEDAGARQGGSSRTAPPTGPGADTKPGAGMRGAADSRAEDVVEERIAAMWKDDGAGHGFDIGDVAAEREPDPTRSTGRGDPGPLFRPHEADAAGREAPAPPSTAAARESARPDSGISDEEPTGGARPTAGDRAPAEPESGGAGRRSVSAVAGGIDERSVDGDAGNVAAEGVRGGDDRGFDVEPVPASDPDGPEPAPRASSGEAADDDGSETFSIEDFGEDEVQTKIDLAQVYIEMGDADSARGFLEAVLAEGDAEQQAIAREMLSKLA